MKKSKVLIFLLMALLMTGSVILSSCGATTEPINVTLVIEAGDDEILHVTMPIAMKEPTVLALVSEAAVIYELNVTYNDNNDSVRDIENYTYRTDENGVTYFWEYLINDVLPENTTGGKANAQPITDGMKITYKYSSYDPKTSK